MEIQSWNQELSLANAQFKRLFSNIAIQQGNKRTRFSCVLGNRSRIFKSLENPDKNAIYNLPLIVIQRTGVTKNNDRLANVNNEVKYATSSRRLNYNIFTPVPIDISYEVTIISKYQEQIDKALSNFIPFFNKDLFVRCQHPKFEGLFFTNQVIMEDGITEDHGDEIDPSTDDLIQATCNFTFKTYMFCGNQKAKQRTTEISTIVDVRKYTGLSSYIRKLTDDDKKHIEDFLDKDLSITVTEQVTTEISTELSVEVPIEDPKQDGFIPLINRMYVGFYPVPLLSSYNRHMDWVDSLCAQGFDDSDYVDRLEWNFDELPDDQG